MGNDIAAHRAAIGLFYCKINEISLKKCVFVKFCFRDVFYNMAQFDICQMTNRTDHYNNWTSI